jgi:hypothetical protein
MGVFLGYVGVISCLSRGQLQSIATAATTPPTDQIRLEYTRLLISGRLQLMPRAGEPAVQHIEVLLDEAPDDRARFSRCTEKIALQFSRIDIVCEKEI